MGEPKNHDAPVVLVVDDTAANLGLVVDTLEAEGLRAELKASELPG